MLAHPSTLSSPLDDRIPEIRERISVEDELARRGHHPARMSGGRSYYHCPFPEHDDHSPSFDVRDGIWTCRSRCGYGDVIELVARLDGLSKADAIARLAESVGLGREDTGRPHKAPRPERALRPEQASRLLAHFAHERQWSTDVLAEVGAHVVLDAFGKPRVRFPFLYGTEVVWHQDRAIFSRQPRYKWLGPKGGKPAVYNLNATRLPAQRDGELVMVEGVSDVLALLCTYESPAVVGIPGVGNFHPTWVPIFAGLRSVVLFSDNDPAGVGFRETVHRLLDGVVGRVLDAYVPEQFNDLDQWRRSFGPDGSDEFGCGLEDAIAAAEERILESVPMVGVSA